MALHMARPMQRHLDAYLEARTGPTPAETSSR